MHMGTKKRRILSDVIGLLSADHASSRDLRTTIGTTLLELLDADVYASYLWNSQTSLFEGGVGVNIDDTSIRNYEAYFQHRHVREKGRWVRRGVLPVSAHISHSELARSEIYNDFLRPSGHYYGINLFAFDGDKSIGDIRIWRKNGRSDFDRDEVTLLGLIEPGLVQTLRRTAFVEAPAVASPSLLARLSRREAAVALLAARGFADKEIARRLNVTFATVRTHLDNAFTKLGVRNRTQLACLLHAAPAGATAEQNSTTH